MSDSVSTSSERTPQRCLRCKQTAFIDGGAAHQPAFCPFCGARYHSGGVSSLTEGHSETAPATTLSLVAGHAPSPSSVLFSIGQYQILSSIGKGGMGEVFLAYDTICGRRIALKKIREDLREHQQLYDRFLKEAHITSQLTHPAIIPIYTIHREEQLLYYTMPYVEGHTLKEVLRRARKKKPHEGQVTTPCASIPSLVRIFHTICNAIAYAHSKNVLHRDLKPENIIIGRYGEVHILDWGLAKMVGSSETPLTAPSDAEGGASAGPMMHALTRLGKVVGTITYMAPERAFGQPATLQTDIYSLGVILYQMLTLRLPFRRAGLKEFRERYHKERYRDPAAVAPYRDVPRALATITQKCLQADPRERYETVEELIHELENYIEGRSEWFKIAKLDIDDKEHWEFQENVLINQHMAITRADEQVDWVSLMISKASFTGNTMVQAKVTFAGSSRGLGIMMCIPEAAERTHINDGYCLWLGTTQDPTTRLLRSTAEVLARPDIILEGGREYTIRVEKIGNNLHLYLNDILQFSYISQLPLAGTHVGILCKDRSFVMHNLSVFVSSLNITVNCLAVPDAFLAHKDYNTALNEYRRIAYSFPGRAEGREALFRAGITLLEQARNTADSGQSRHLLDMAMAEFEKQRDTPGAPLEYAGKALVYRHLQDYDEEAKCYELSLRRYEGHPLLPVLHEQLLYRMYETSKTHRRAAYQLLLLCMRFLPADQLAGNVRRLCASLQRHWEPLDFIRQTADAALPLPLHDSLFAMQLAFWLAKVYVIEEITCGLLNAGSCPWVALSNAVFALTELGASASAASLLRDLAALRRSADTFGVDAIAWKTLHLVPQLYQGDIEAFQKAFIATLGAAPLAEQRCLSYVLLRRLLRVQRPELAIALCDKFLSYALSHEERLKYHQFYIWALLLQGRWQEAGTLLHHYPLELLSHESTPLHFLYGCWLLVSEGREIADVHFAGILEVPLPRSWTLMAYDLHGKLGLQPNWEGRAFMWERRHLYQQLALFYHCAGDKARMDHYLALEAEEYVSDHG